MGIPSYKNPRLKDVKKKKAAKRISGLKWAKQKESNETGNGNVPGLPDMSGDHAAPGISSNGDSSVSSEPEMYRDILSGRRIVEFVVMLNALWCSKCREMLHMHDIYKETQHGLGSLFHVKCRGCGKENEVPSGKRHSASEGGRTNIFDINTKLALAMIAAGIGESQINLVLSLLNLPSISLTTLKKREREISKTVKKVAKKSCTEAIKEERELTCQENSDSGCKQGECGCKCAVLCDGGWQQKGSGRSYNSQSGHVTVLGKKSKKCLNFSVAKKGCRFCRVAKSRNKEPSPHECGQNWNGSSKAMEPFLTVKSLQELKEEGMHVEEVTMDDDSVTLSRIRRSVFPDVKKRTDKNHAHRNFTSSLYKVKDEKVKTMAPGTIKYIKTCFSKVVQQNEGNPDGIESNLSAVVPHALGDHSGCPENSWCKRSSSDHGITNDNKEALQDFVAKYTTDDMKSKLSSLGSTNAVENMNRLISRKAPKDISYAESESLNTRIETTVIQKNEGYIGFPQVNVEHGLSPGKNTIKKCDALDAKRRKKKDHDNSAAFKRRRYELKEERTHRNTLREVEEGPSYATGVGHLDEPALSVEIPAPPEAIEPVCKEFSRNDIVVFDVETTGLTNGDCIIQISARHMSTGKSYSVYIKPTCAIQQTAVNITGIEFHGGVMFQDSVPVPYKHAPTALQEFGTWLSGLESSTPVLSAHNVAFDSRMLVAEYKRAGVEIPTIISRFADTLAYFKKKFGRKGRGVNTLQSLIKAFLPNRQYNFHNADEDTRALADLLDVCGCDGLGDSMVSKQEIELRARANANKSRFMGSYKDGIDNELITKTLSEKLSKAGIGLSHLKSILEQSGTDGLNIFITSRCGRSKFVTENIVQAME